MGDCEQVVCVCFYSRPVEQEPGRREAVALGGHRRVGETRRVRDLMQTPLRRAQRRMQFGYPRRLGTAPEGWPGERHVSAAQAQSQLGKPIRLITAETRLIRRSLGSRDGWALRQPKAG